MFGMRVHNASPWSISRTGRMMGGRSYLMTEVICYYLKSITRCSQWLLHFKSNWSFPRQFFQQFFSSQVVPAHWALPECPYGQSATVRYNLLINGLVSFFQTSSWTTGLASALRLHHCTVQGLPPGTMKASHNEKICVIRLFNVIASILTTARQLQYKSVSACLNELSVMQ